MHCGGGNVCALDVDVGSSNACGALLPEAQPDLASAVYTGTAVSRVYRAVVRFVILRSYTNTLLALLVVYEYSYPYSRITRTRRQEQYTERPCRKSEETFFLSFYFLKGSS